MKNEQDITTGARRPRKIKGRHVLFGLRAALLLALIPVVFLCVAAFLLIGRDIDAPDWVTQKIAQEAESRLNGARLTFDALTLNVGKDLHPRVTMEGVTLLAPDGTSVGSVGAVKGLLSPRGVILEQRALLQDVHVRGVDIALELQSELAVAISIGDAGQRRSIPAEIDAVLAELDLLFQSPALEALETVRLQDTTLKYNDAAGGVEIVAVSGQSLLDVSGQERRLQADFVLRGDQAAGPIDLALSFKSALGGADALADMTLDAQSGAALAALHPAFSALHQLSAPLSISSSLQTDQTGALKPIDINVNVGKGAVLLDAGPSFDLEGVTAALQHQIGTDRWQVGRFALESSVLSLVGTAVAERTDAGVILQVQGNGVQLTLPKGVSATGPIEAVYADLRLNPQAGKVELGALTVNDPALSLTAQGAAIKGVNGIDVALDFAMPTARREQVMAFWPEDIARGSRQWFDGYMPRVDFKDISGSFRRAADGKIQWSLGFSYSDAILRILKSMPPIEGAAGYASFSGGAFGTVLSDGYFSPKAGGRISVAGSTFEIPDLNVKGGPMRVSLDTDSSVTAVFALLDQSPLRVMEKAQRPVDLADGRAQITGVIEFPRVNPVPPDQIRYDIAAGLSRVSSTRLIPGRTFRASDLTVAADNQGFEVTGPATLDNVPLTGVYTQRFGASASTLRADIAISPETMAALDIALPQGMVSGRGVGALDVSFAKGAAPSFNLASDLRGLRVAVPAVGWSKAPAEAGALRVSGTLGARPSITDLRVSGGGLTARGRVSVGADGGLEAARFDQLSIGNWFNAPLTLRGRGAGRPPAVEISGGSLDLRSARFGASQGESGPLALRLDRLQISEGIALTNFQGDFAGRGGFNGQFTASLNGGPAIAGTVVPQNGRSAVRLRSNDAGGLARAAGVLKGGDGGVLDLVLSPAGGAGTFDGSLSIRGLRVRDAPAMAALLDAISVVGLLQQMDGRGLSFDEVDARFRLSPSQVVLTQASAIGPGLGISLDGVYALASKQLDLQGVISPFYLLNGIGSFLTRRGEGLIGFNFTVTGSTSAPQVSVNPLSALTPGMFREIFRRPPPQVSQ